MSAIQSQQIGSGRVPGTAVVEADDLIREEPELVFFRACRHGPAWPFLHRHYSGEIRSRQMVWPEWLPYAHPRDLAPQIASVHVHWPVASVEHPGRVAPDQRVAVITYRGQWVIPVRTILRRAGWIDMTDQWLRVVEARREAVAAAQREAVARLAEAPIAPAPSALNVVGDVVVKARARRAAASDAAGA